MLGKRKSKEEEKEEEESEEIAVLADAFNTFRMVCDVDCECSQESVLGIDIVVDIDTLCADCAH